MARKPWHAFKTSLVVMIYDESSISILLPESLSIPELSSFPGSNLLSYNLPTIAPPRPAPLW
eukprot:scaffold1357_cov94-Skeletonema_dohrnii-CCMP3373.AAC.2